MFSKDRKRAYEAPLRRLVEQIVLGELTPEQSLPREENLAERFEVSRVTMREALRWLEACGLIEVVQGRGQTVRRRTHWRLMDPHVLTVVLDQPGDSELTAVILEEWERMKVAEARQAAERATAAQVEGLRMELTQHWEAGLDLARPAASVSVFRHDDEPVVACIRFHRLIADAADPSAVVSTVLDADQVILRDPRVRSAVGREGCIARHAELLAALEWRDPERAAEAMRAHVEAIVELLSRGPIDG